MLRYAEVFIAVANSLEAEQEPPWPDRHVLGHVFGPGPQIARRQGTLTGSRHWFVKVVEVACRQANPRFLCHGGSIRTHGGHINLGAELSNFRVRHTGPDVSPRHSEPVLPATPVQDFWYTAHTPVDDEVLDPGDVP